MCKVPISFPDGSNRHVTSAYLRLDIIEIDARIKLQRVFAHDLGLDIPGQLRPVGYKIHRMGKRQVFF